MWKLTTWIMRLLIWDGSTTFLANQLWLGHWAPLALKSHWPGWSLARQIATVHLSSLGEAWVGHQGQAGSWPTRRHVHRTSKSLLWCMGTFSEGPRHAPTHCEQKVPWSNVFKLYLLCWCLFANCYPDPNQHFGFCLLAFEVWSSSTGSKASLSQCWSPWRVWHRRGWVAWGLNSEHCKGMPHGSIWWMHCSLAAIGFICCSLNLYFCRWLRFVTSVPGKTM